MYKKRRRYLLIVLFIVVLAIFCMNPLSFVRDGLLTKMKVEEYDGQWMGVFVKPHKEEGVENVYLLYLGLQDVVVETEEVVIESQTEHRKIEEVAVKEIAPFLYKWEYAGRESVYRVGIGKDKYYFAIVTN